jgi:aryl-alcohol dehydrogenase-like predicted oxidoreductase
MKYRTLAGTDIRVSEIGFGLWTLATGRWGRFTDTEAAALVHRALTLGLNFFVTADFDGEGRGEEILFKALHPQREEIVIAVKVGYDFYHAQSRIQSGGKIIRCFTPEYIRFAVDKSLQRLKCDRIDLLQLHDVTEEACEDGELWETLAGLKRAGKVRHLGASLGPGAGWLKEARALMGSRQPIAIEHLHHLLEPRPGLAIEAEAYRDAKGGELRDFRHGLMPDAPEQKASFIVRGPHASGLLEGRLTRDTVFPPGDPRGEKGADWLDAGLTRAERFQFLTGKDTGRTLAQAALLWLLAEPTVASCLPNIATREELEAFALAAEKNALTREELLRVAELL